MKRSLVLLLVLVAAFAGCALTQKAAAMKVLYFTPGRDTAADSGATAGAGDGVRPAVALRLGRVTSATYIRDKLVLRRGPHQIAFRESWRWTEAPEAFVGRALARALFLQHGVQEQVSGPGLTLDVELETFEEQTGPPRMAHVELTWRLRNDRLVLVQHKVTVDRAITGNPTDGEAVAAAMSAALGTALDQIVSEVVTELEVRAAP